MHIRVYAHTYRARFCLLNYNEGLVKCRFDSRAPSPIKRMPRLSLLCGNECWATKLGMLAFKKKNVGDIYKLSKFATQVGLT